MPKFSIITVCLNAASTIEGAINSVLSQTCPPSEYIIIDGGSTDGTPDIIERYRSRLAHVISEPDRGIYDAFNKGLALASGDIIGILNADDVYAPWALESVAGGHAAQPGAGVFYGKLAVVDEQRGCWTVYPIGNHRNMLSNMSIAHPATFVLRSMYERHGFFDPSLKISGDWDFMLCLYHANETFCPIDSVLTAFRNSGVYSLPSLRLRQENRRIYRNNLPPLAAFKSIAKMELKYHGKRLIGALGLGEVYARYRDEKLLNAEASGKFEGFSESFWKEISNA